MLSNLFLAGSNRLVLTCYKTNSSQNGSRNPTTLKKDLQIKKQQKHSLLSQTLILHMEKLLGLSLKLSNHKYWIVTQNCHLIWLSLQSRKFSNNTGLPELGLAKSDLRLSSWPIMKFKEDFLNKFYFTLPFFQDLCKRWINNKLKLC